MSVCIWSLKAARPRQKGSGDNPAIALLSGAGQQATGEGRHQRDDHRGLGVDARAVPRRQRDPGSRPRPAHCSKQRAQLRDLQTGGWGDAIQGPLNGPQTPTMANFATLADLLSGCVTRVTADACNQLFAAATPPKGERPDRHPDRCPVHRSLPLVSSQSASSPCWTSSIRSRRARTCARFHSCRISTSPSAWVLPLKFDGGGYRAGGKAMFDSEGNLWVGNNFTVGWQGQD